MSCSMAVMCLSPMRAMLSQKRWLVSCPEDRGSRRRSAVFWYQSIGHVGLAAGGHAAVEGGRQQVLTDRGSLGSPFGHVAIHGGEQIDGPRHIPHRCGGSEFIDGQLGRFGAHQAIQDALRGT